MVEVSAAVIPKLGGYQNQLPHFSEVEIMLWEGDVCLQGQTPWTPPRAQGRFGTMGDRTATAG